jgi:uncharacterized phage-associated protein
MTTAREVAEYIRGTGHSFFGEMQMHKILYYAQAWSLAWDGRPLFEDEIQAWAMGPVVPALRHSWPVPSDPNVPLSETQKANIEAVLSHYGQMGGQVLGHMTHGEEPWLEAWGDRPANVRGWDTISHASMRRAYTRQSAAGKGPHRRAVATQTVDRSRLLARTAKAKREWSHTLARLAE